MSVEQAVRNLENLVKNFEKERDRILRLYKDKKYNIAIIGTGDDKSIGSHIASSLSQYSQNIENLILCNRTEISTEWLKKIFEFKHLTPKIRTYDNIGKWLSEDNIDIAIVAAGKFFIDRNEELKYNAELTKQIAPQFQGYNGSTIILTNPVDTIAQEFASLSQCNPFSIMGFSQLDTVRGENILWEILHEEIRKMEEEDNSCRLSIDKEYFSLQIIGAHNYIEKDDEIIHCMIPYLDNTMVNATTPLKSLRIMTRELYETLKAAIPKYGDEQYEMLKDHTGTASKLVGNTMTKHILRAFNDPEYVISMSVWDPKRELYVTWPTKVKDMFAAPISIDLTGTIYEPDFNIVCERVLKPNVEYLRGVGITAKPAKEEKPVGRTLKGKLEDLKEDYEEDFEKQVRKVGRRERKESRNRFDHAKERVELEIRKSNAVISIKEVEKPEEQEQLSLEGRLYYENMPGDHLIIKSQQLSPEVTAPDKKYKVEVDGHRYDCKIGIRKIIPHGDKLFVEALYNHKDTKISHWVWFDTTNGKIQGTIKPEGVINIHKKDREKTPILPCFHNEIMDTAAFFKNKLYFIVEEPLKDEQLVEFNPVNGEYNLMGTGAIDGEKLTCMIAVEDDLILGTDRNLYRLHNGRLKYLSKTACSAYFIKSIPDERVIVYSDNLNENIYAVQIDSPLNQTVFRDGPLFDIHQNGDISMATINRDRIQLSKYSCVDNFLTKREDRSPIFSQIVENLKRVIILNEDIVIGMCDDNSKITLQPLYSSTLQPCSGPIVIENATYLTAEFDVK